MDQHKTPTELIDLAILFGQACSRCTVDRLIQSGQTDTEWTKIFKRATLCRLNRQTTLTVSVVQAACVYHEQVDTRTFTYMTVLDIMLRLLLLVFCLFVCFCMFFLFIFSIMNVTYVS